MGVPLPQKTIQINKESYDIAKINKHLASSKILDIPPSLLLIL